MHNHAEVIQAIQDRQEVLVTFSSKEDQGQVMSRRCAPMDYGPAKITKVQEDRYHFWDFESDSGTNHILSPALERIISVEVLDSTFDPGTFVTWQTNWHVPRDTWGQFS